VALPVLLCVWPQWQGANVPRPISNAPLYCRTYLAWSISHFSARHKGLPRPPVEGCVWSLQRGPSLRIQCFEILQAIGPNRFFCDQFKYAVPASCAPRAVVKLSAQVADEVVASAESLAVNFRVGQFRLHYHRGLIASKYGVLGSCSVVWRIAVVWAIQLMVVCV